MNDWEEMEFIKCESEGRYIHLWGRDTNKVKHHYKIIDFFPYFYTFSPERLKGKNGVVRIEEKPYKTLFGEDIYKVIVNHPGLVPKLRIKDDYEADISYIDRFLIDTNIAGKFWIKKSKINKKEISINDIKGNWKYSINGNW